MQFVPRSILLPTLLLAGAVLCVTGCKKETKKAPVSRTEKKQPAGDGSERRMPMPDVPAETGPLAKYRTGKIDSRVRSVPGQAQSGVFKDPARYLPQLVEYITGDTSDNFLKVKRIHDWIADNIAYDTESYFGGSHRGGGGLEDVLRKGSSVCEGYSTVFDRMCELAGIHSVKVSGYARGFGFNPWKPEDPTDSNHAWNAVEIDGEYYLVDTTWDAGSIFTGKNWEKRYSTHFLFASPEAFIHTHFPTESGWQLLKPARTAEQFLKLPYLRGEFFSSGLRLASPLSILNEVGNSAQMQLAAPPSTLLLARVETQDGRKLENRSFIQRDMGKATVHALFPSAGPFKLALFAKQAGDPGKYNLVAAFGFDASAGTRQRFPKTYQMYSDLGCDLLEPLHAPLPRGKPVNFRIRVPAGEAVAVVQNDSDWTELTKKRDSLYEGDVTITSELPVKVFVRLDPNDKQWKGLLEYP